MKTFAIAMLLCLTAGAKCRQVDQDQDRRAVVQASNAFTTALYKALSGQFGNLVVSPLSVETVLAMAWLGAGGETARQLAAGLQLPESRAQVEAGFMALLSSLKSTDAVTLNITNKMYVQEGFRIKDAFRRAAVEKFLSDVQAVDFARSPNVARNSINQWVEEKTHNKIKDLIAPGTLSGNTLLVLLNAIYFKGNWLNAFDESLTFTAPFRLTPSVATNVSMMQQKQMFSYGDFPELKFKALRLPYQGGTSSMLLILPNEIEGLRRLQAGIATLNLMDITSKMSEEEVDVFLPRFRIEKTMNLIRPLQQLGIIDIFMDGANFTGITDQNIYVSSIVQKAFIEVNEKGTEAAAATDLGFGFRSGAPNPLFKADHPFLFFVLDDNSGAVLFMGRVVSPK